MNWLDHLDIFCGSKIWSQCKTTTLSWEFVLVIEHLPSIIEKGKKIKFRKSHRIKIGMENLQVNSHSRMLEVLQDTYMKTAQ